MSKSKKGGQFERDFCRNLSEWWTGGKHDDVFWRSSQSGGRATTRKKSGKRTTGHEGDVAATHVDGYPLLRVFTIELKRGYSKTSIQDLLDRKKHMAEQEYEKFLEQAITAQEGAESMWWMLVVRRDQRRAIVFLPADCMTACGLRECVPFMRFKTARYRNGIMATTLTQFFKHVQPDTIRKLAEARSRRP